jgi:hypothetical protein
MAFINFRIKWSRDSSVGIAMSYRLGSRLSSPDRGNIFLSARVSVVFKALNYKPEGRGFEPDEVNEVFQFP